MSRVLQTVLRTFCLCLALALLGPVTAAQDADYLSLDVMEIPRGTGTGFVWYRNSLVVTNLDVI